MIQKLQRERGREGERKTERERERLKMMIVPLPQPRSLNDRNNASAIILWNDPYLKLQKYILVLPTCWSSKKGGRKGKITEI